LGNPRPCSSCPAHPDSLRLSGHPGTPSVLAPMLPVPGLFLVVSIGFDCPFLLCSGMALQCCIRIPSGRRRKAAAPILICRCNWLGAAFTHALGEACLHSTVCSRARLMMIARARSLCSGAVGLAHPVSYLTCCHPPAFELTARARG
jgi:hypothetical protein